jgi:nitroimidazol reductase NimA-like FMN-containing flavoprotein (pyridoxamine 5'-phosphate oxidase superfamily)
VTVQTWHVEIGAEECARLLASAVVGRLGVIVDGRPQIFPVNHVYDPASGCVAFPTQQGTKLRAALSWPFVAFEVDGLEPGDKGGWSVLVVGTAEEITDPAEIRTLTGRRHVLWVADRSAHWVRIVPATVTGRRISAVTVR